MRKLFLLLALVATAATQSYGYEGHKYGDNSYYYQLSPNGQWLLGGEDGIAMFCYVPDSTVYTYESDYELTYYQLGMGNAISNDGLAVGATDDYTPAYWKAGVWTALPLKNGESVGYASGADGITPDSSVICGCISTMNSFGMDSNGTTYLPAVWTRNADGTYGEYELLPHPETDFTGRAPQYITARCISDDGRTVAGQVMSYDGYATYPIVYTKADDGTWSYKEYGLEAIYDYDGEWPKYPNYYPECPFIDDYLSDEDKAAYDAAVDEWQAAYEEYKAGNTSVYPTYPNKKDYLSDTSKYDADMAVYNEDYKEYCDSVDAFDEVYYNAITGASFYYNTVALSGNGKYLMQTIQMEDPYAEDDDFGWGASYISAPVLIAIEDGEMDMADASDMIGTSVANDGTMFAASPATEYTRSAYAIDYETLAPVKFDEWMAAQSEGMADWMSENMLYDVVKYTLDEETYEYSEETVPDSLITGSLVANAEATCFVTYVYDQWNSYMYDSYYMNIVDTQNPTAIETIANKPQGCLSVAVADGRISADGMKSIALYDLQGRKVADAQGSLRADVAKGVYVVRGTAADGSTLSRKVAVGQ